MSGFSFERLVEQPVAWIDESQKSDVILSSRIRLARNLSSVPFPSEANLQNLQQVISSVQQARGQVSGLRRAVFLEMGDVSHLERQILVERRLISPEFARSRVPRALIIGTREKLSIMVNEEDHLRIQVLYPGFNLSEAWDQIRSVDQQLGQELEIAFSEQFGFLTACPTNVGTGMRVSIFVHLPALVQTRGLDKVLGTKMSFGISIRGFYGEGSQIVGHIFQISNQKTLGWTEWRILEDMIKLARELIHKEQESRAHWWEKDRIRIEDKIYRSCGILSKARVLSSSEFIEHYSNLQLGIYLGILKEINQRALNRLLVLTQPAHLQKLRGKRMDSLERDVFRAELVRQHLKL